MNDYRRYRNLAVRQAKVLQRRFYEKKVRDLRICDSRNWCRYTKRFLGQRKQSELTSLANAVTDGDMQALAEVINVSLKKVTDDIKPLDPADSIALDCVPEQFVIDPDTACAVKARANKRTQSSWTSRNFELVFARLCGLYT